MCLSFAFLCQYRQKGGLSRPCLSLRTYTDAGVSVEIFLDLSNNI